MWGSWSRRGRLGATESFRCESCGRRKLSSLKWWYGEKWTMQVCEIKSKSLGITQELVLRLDGLKKKVVCRRKEPNYNNKKMEAVVAPGSWSSFSILRLISLCLSLLFFDPQAWAGGLWQGPKPLLYLVLAIVDLVRSRAMGQVGYASLVSISTSLRKERNEPKDWMRKTEENGMWRGGGGGEGGEEEEGVKSRSRKR